jgi:hypothetical protein
VYLYPESPAIAIASHVGETARGPASDISSPSDNAMSRGPARMDRRS